MLDSFEIPKTRLTFAAAGADGPDAAAFTFSISSRRAHVADSDNRPNEMDGQLVEMHGHLTLLGDIPALAVC